jgi:ankyrin repeat protein
MDNQLLNACKNGDLIKVNKMIDCSMDVVSGTVPICDLTQALIYTAHYGHAEIVNRLIEHNIDIHSNNEFVLRETVYDNQTGIMNILFNYGANVDVAINNTPRLEHKERLQLAKNNHDENTLLVKGARD